MRSRVRTVVGLALTLSLVGGMAHGATWVSRGDPNDVEGSLDIKKLEILVPKDTVFGPGDPVKCRVSFYGTAQFVEDGDHVNCYFDIKGDQNADVWSTTEKSGDVIDTTLYTLNGVIGHPAWKFADGTLTVSIPRAKLRGREKFLRWYVASDAHNQDYYDTTSAAKYVYGSH